MSRTDEESTPEFPKDVVEEGSKIVTEFLQAWARGSSMDGEDVRMDEDLSDEDQVRALKECLEKFQSRIEANPWVRSLLTKL